MVQCLYTLYIHTQTDRHTYELHSIDDYWEGGVAERLQKCPCNRIAELLSRMRAGVHARLRACVHICTCTHTHARTRARTHARTYTGTHACARACTFSTRMRAHACTCALICVTRHSPSLSLSLPHAQMLCGDFAAVQLYPCCYFHSHKIMKTTTNICL